MSAVVLIVFILLVLIYAAVKKVNLYHSFSDGVREALKLIYSVFPYIATVCIAVAVFNASGLSRYLYTALEPVFSFFGIPKGLVELIIIRPLSGSGSLVVFEDVISKYGVDSASARAAAVIMGSSDTIFFIGALYYSKRKNKKSGAFFPIALFTSFVGVLISCLLIRVL